MTRLTKTVSNLQNEKLKTMQLTKELLILQPGYPTKVSTSPSQIILGNSDSLKITINKTKPRKVPRE